MPIEGSGKLGEKVQFSPEEEHERKMLKLEAEGLAVVMWHPGKGFRFQLVTVNDKDNIEKSKKRGYLETRKIGPGEYEIIGLDGKQVDPKAEEKPKPKGRGRVTTDARKANSEAFTDS